MNYEDAVDVLIDAMVDDQRNIPARLHDFLCGKSDVLPAGWTDDALIRLAESVIVELG